FASLPALVSRVQVSGTLEEMSRRVPLDEIGTVLVRGGELWSFAPAALVQTVLKPVMKEAKVRESRREEIEADPDLARVLSWLLRKHFEGQLRSLHGRGLMLEAVSNAELSVPDLTTRLRVVVERLCVQP
ncbi:MAG: hypothetical protein J0I87_05290, partial [Cellulomonas sp.]|nr:hypothetical protein [Cellulomonas sp.]